MTQKQDIEYLEAYQKELLDYYKVFWDLCPCDLVKPEVPSERQQNKLLFKYADYLELLAKEVKSISRAKRLYKLAKLLSEDTDFRSRRARTLVARQKRSIERSYAKHDAKVECIARLADDNGFNGSLFRDIIPSDNPLSIQQAKRLRKKIEEISKIIAAIEKPSDRSKIHNGAELLCIPQVALMLGCGESVVRERNRKGFIPSPIRIGGALQWRKKELSDWIETGCPPRQKWQLLKQGKES